MAYGGNEVKLMSLQDFGSAPGRNPAFGINIAFISPQLRGITSAVRLDLNAVCLTK